MKKEIKVCDICGKMLNDFPIVHVRNYFGHEMNFTLGGTLIHSDLMAPVSYDDASYKNPNLHDADLCPKCLLDMVYKVLPTLEKLVKEGSK